MRDNGEPSLSGVGSVTEDDPQKLRLELIWFSPASSRSASYCARRCDTATSAVPYIDNCGWMPWSSTSSPHRQPSFEVAQPKSTRLRRPVRRTITSMRVPPYIQVVKPPILQMSLCRMPRACRSVRMVAVCACQSYGKFRGLTGSPTASKTMPCLLWQSSCGAHATSRSRRRKQASRLGWKAVCGPFPPRTLRTHLPSESKSTRDCMPTCTLPRGQKHSLPSPLPPRRRSTH
eukprot:scaffold44612_cov58-Phaeocystis_antarctica.AAC.4